MDWDNFYAHFSAGQVPLPGLNHLSQSNMEANGTPSPAVQTQPQEAAHNNQNNNAIPPAPIAPGAGVQNVHHYNAPVQLGGQGLGEPVPMYVNVHGGYVNGGNANGGSVNNNHFNGGNNLTVHAPPPNPAPAPAPAVKPCDHPGCTNPVNHPGPRVKKCEAHLVSRVGPGRAAKMAACRTAGLDPCRGCTSGRPQRARGQSCWKCHHTRLKKRPKWMPRLSLGNLPSLSGPVLNKVPAFGYL
ncbi:hypothetical protein B0H65DRAFT_553570 [Neurospora tetraspora]|uniref:Uncharacterized protein n=1 Tax=Neurospora tetraspora TaxID=94610 RepID=A0AAE0J0C2_9PEZI|nr:hypothetical protein B0H65DRAFT_553570 [Neurospora tetraspora]